MNKKEQICKTRGFKINHTNALLKSNIHKLYDFIFQIIFVYFSILFFEKDDNSILKYWFYVINIRILTAN